WRRLGCGCCGGRRQRGEKDLRFLRLLGGCEGAADQDEGGRYEAVLHEPRPLCAVAADFRVVAESCGCSAERRWRAASKSTTAPAAETLREATSPAMGIRSRRSQVRRTRSCRPA